MKNSLFKIAVLPGDGIGPEVMAQSLKVLDAAAQRFKFKYEAISALVGGAAIDASGSAFPDETVQVCDEADAILFGSVGGPKWQNLPPEERPERASLLPIRKRYGLYCNIRPAILVPGLMELSPLNHVVVGRGFDINIVRELTGGIYFTDHRGIDGEGPDRRAYDLMEYTYEEIRRVATVAFDAARGRRCKVTSVDKANVLSTSILWRQVVCEVAKGFSDVELDHMYVDNAAMQLVRDPSQFDVILTSNMFGDILSDIGAIITGSMGMLASASIGDSGFGLYEPAGGSAPDIAGTSTANPIAQILSVAMLLRYSAKRPDIAEVIEGAVQQVLADGLRTRDIAAKNEHVSTKAMGDALVGKLRKH